MPNHDQYTTRSWIRIWILGSTLPDLRIHFDPCLGSWIRIWILGSTLPDSCIHFDPCPGSWIRIWIWEHILRNCRKGPSHEGGRAARRAPLGKWARRTLRDMRARPSAPPRPGHHSCTPRSSCACICAYLPRAGGWIACALALLAPSARGVPYFSTASALALWPAARPHDTLLESCFI